MCVEVSTSTKLFYTLHEEVQYEQTVFDVHMYDTAGAKNDCAPSKTVVPSWLSAAGTSHVQ